ncbi:MAG: MotA/TolQ/ExbB proton channel family protein, partial [Planctomycetes bacterium]|nr:MotA/TolQ/ExbB proton channel family protein [Planctomycetota bacterium]
VAFAIERLIGLRRSKIAPKKLVTSLKTWDLGTGGVDPRHAYDLCQMHPSALSRVIMTAIMKVGRPHSEIEKSVEDALAREADEMSHNIRPINVAISIAPLLGLLGTVQGMILAFMVTSTSSATGTAKGQELAQGIYVALVTTFAGLCVAIPGTVFASALEARIDRLLRDMEDILNGVLPQFERYEGKVRVARSRDNEGDAVTLVKPVPSQIKPAGESPRTSDSAPAPGPGKQTVVAPRSGRSE